MPSLPAILFFSSAQILTDLGWRVPRSSMILRRVRPVSTMSSTMMTSRPAMSVVRSRWSRTFPEDFVPGAVRGDLEEVERDGGLLELLGEVAEEEDGALEDPDEQRRPAGLVAVDLRGEPGDSLLQGRLVDQRSPELHGGTAAGAGPSGSRAV